MKTLICLIFFITSFLNAQNQAGYTLWQPYSYMAQSATIRIEKGLCNGEKEYLEKRFDKVKAALEDILKMKLQDHQIPRIAFCCSGGGYRSMIATAGSLIGAESFGLLDAASYISCISGSTWCVAPWISLDVSISQFRELLVDKIKNGLFSNKILKNLWFPILKNCINKNFTIIDLFGALLGQVLLSGPERNPHEMYLHSQLNLLKDAKYIYPIYTSVVEELTDLEWLEFTPHEVGADSLGGFIPSWSLGRKFIKGISEDTAEAPTLSYLLGLWGSAFKEFWKDFIFQQQKNLNSSNRLKKFFMWPLLKILGNIQVGKASIANLSYQLFDDKLHHLKYLQLVDAGVYCNLPIMPLMRSDRQVDIIIILDASKEIKNLQELRRAQFYAKSKGHEFPEIDDANADKKICSVFQSPDAPVIIYMPCIKNKNYSEFDPYESIISKGYCDTTNFSYTQDQIYELSGLTEFNIKESKEIIISVIKQVIKEKG